MFQWLATFHGGKSSSNINALVGLFLSGTLPRMCELRGFTFDGSGNLYIANANKSLSQVLLFRPTASGTYSASSTPFIAEGLSHPFDIATDDAGNFYVTNQDLVAPAAQGSLQVSRYDASGHFQGAFVPNPTLRNPGPALYKLRGIARSEDTWFVADEAGDATGSGKKGSGAVYVYDGSGAYQGAIGVADPIHLLVYQGILFIGSGALGAVFYFSIGSGATSAAPLLVAPAISPAGTSGLSIPGDGYLYVGSRKSCQVLRYQLELAPLPQATGGEVFFDQLPDCPEFIGVVPVTRTAARHV